VTGGTAAKGPVALLHFDAHTDTSEGPIEQHGTMFRHAANSGDILAEQSLQIGIRTAYLKDDAYMRLHAPEAMAMDPSDMADLIVDRLGGTPCYLTFDMDCVDPGFALGTGTPIPGGLSTLHVLNVIRALGPHVAKGSITSVGLDLIELAPCYDHAQMTSLAAAQIAQEMLCMLSAGR